MGNLICTSSYSSKGNSSAQTTDYSTLYPQQGHLRLPSIYRVQNHPLMSSPTSRKTVITSNGAFSRSTEDLLEEVNRQLMMRHPKH
uniref:Putative AC4 protein n=1 Tax=Tomato infectious yellows virus TaxID=172393 RepID=Q8QPU3_9GEMI|nr:putative AC4 protein [Tomato infectious yellows virus]